MNTDQWWAVVVTVTTLLGPQTCNGHGYLLEPPARASMWRDHLSTIIDYDDNALNCGGLNEEWYVQHGKCGVCGDPWIAPQPRDNEDGGKYGTGRIARTYLAGQDINVVVVITANHLGWFEFRLCPRESTSVVLTHECLDQHILQLADGSGTRLDIGAEQGPIDLKVRLPAGLTCSHCVLQWKYHGDNNRGGDPNVQEEFYGCSDIEIKSNGITILPPTTAVPLTSTPQLNVPTWIPSGQGSSQCRAVGVWAGKTQFDQWCKVNCKVYQTCNPMYCDPSCNSAQTESPSTTIPTTQTPAPTTLAPLTFAPMSTYYPTNQPTQGPANGLLCYAINSWQGVTELDQFCHAQCLAAKCLAPYCSCLSEHSKTTAPTLPPPTLQPTTAPTLPPPTLHPTTAPTLPPPTLQPTTATPPVITTKPQVIKTNFQCYGINAWHGFPELDQYCADQCSPGKCELKTCRCSETTMTSQPITPKPTTVQPVHVDTATPSRDSGSNPLHCYAVGTWSGQPQFDEYCNHACSSYTCDPQYCRCDNLTHNVVTPPPTTATTPAPVTQSSKHCHAVGAWTGHAELDEWCTETCIKFVCNPQFCAC